MYEAGKRIKEIRDKRGLSQEELAELSKVNLRTVQRIENNETIPRERTLRLIYDALGIELPANCLSPFISTKITLFTINLNQKGRHNGY